MGRRSRPAAAALFCTLLLAGTLQSCRRTPEAPPSPRTVVRFTTGQLGGGFYPMGRSIAQAYARSLASVTVQTYVSAGAVANVESIQRGETDLAFTFADVAYVASLGELDGRTGAFDRLRGIAVLQLTPLHFVARAGSGIRVVADLRNRRVSIGAPGTGTSLIAKLLLEAYGVPLSSVHVEPLTFSEAARQLVAGELDAMFDDAIYPADSVGMALRAGARLLPITGPSVERLHREYPFFQAAVIPPNSYPGVTGAIHTIGVDSLLVCRRDLDEALVYELTKGFFEALPELSASIEALRLMDLHQSPATPIPLHAGAARYYRERELER
jgi:TRAP transporter TAXI family solute receptor